MFGLTEKEFWETNPMKLQVYEEAYRNQQNWINNLVHSWVGSYGMSALVTAIAGCFSKRSSAKYIEKPIEIFQKTEKEKQMEAEQAKRQFMAWAGMTKNKYKEKGG